MNYRNERGLVGTWKGLNVVIIEKEDYIKNQYNCKEDTVYVIADDRMRMIHNGMIVGTLNSKGNVSECKHSRYRPLPQTEKKTTEVPSTPGEISLEVTVAEGYYEQYAGEVNEFFKHLQDPVIID